MPKKQDLFADGDFVRAVFETVGALIVVMDRDGRVVYFNRACEHVTGFCADEVIGEEIWTKLIPAEMCEAVQGVFDTLVAGDFPSTYENPWLTKNGGLRYISWSNTAMVDEAGEVTHVIGTGIDISEHIKTEEQLINSEAKASDVLENINEVFWVGSPDWQEVHYVSPAYEDLWGCSRESLYANPHSWLDSVHPDDRGAVSNDIQKKQVGIYPIRFFRNTVSSTQTVKCAGFWPALFRSKMITVKFYALSASPKTYPHSKKLNLNWCGQKTRLNRPMRQNQSFLLRPATICASPCRRCACLFMRWIKRSAVHPPIT